MDAERRIERIWRWYKRRPSKSLRDALVENYADLLSREARKLRARLPAAIELDDLLSDGALGLLDAIDRFVPGKSSFEAFSQQRIRGAMVDGLRSRDAVSRSTRQTIRKLEDAAESFRVNTGVHPTPEEISQQAGLSLQEYARKELLIREASTRSLSGERIWSDGKESAWSPDHLPDQRQESPSRALLRKAMRETIVTGLSRAERLIVLLYYYEGMSMREIGLVLDLSESRICQMHASILARLKARLSEVELRV